MRPRRVAMARAVLLQAWRAAQKRIARDGAAELSVDEEAGRLLAKWESANAAHAMATGPNVAALLAAVVIEEGGAVVPPGRSAS